MRLTYRWEKLFVAINSLATGTEPLQDRLGYAYIGALLWLRPENFPEGEHRSRFEFVRQMMTTAEPVGDEGSVAATTRKMTNQEAVEIATEIVRLFDAEASGEIPSVVSSEPRSTAET